MKVASRLADGAQGAIRWTRHALDERLRSAGLQSHPEGRKPVIPPTTEV